MPLDYHPQHCPCRECRSPADRKWPAASILSAACLVGLVVVSLSVFAFVNFMTGAGQ